MAAIEPAAAPAAGIRGRTAGLALAQEPARDVLVAMMDEELVASGYGYERFTDLAGPLGRPDPVQPSGSSSGAFTAAAANG
jgi:hypothetical protein